MNYRIDGLQYSLWSEKIFHEMLEGGLHAVHATIAYHENFRETIAKLELWNRWFQKFPDLILHGRSASDIEIARKTGRIAIFFGFQNPSPIEDDIGLLEIWHRLGVRIMQLTYNNQSLLATGCYESRDSGITRMGRQVIKEMNRVGLLIDMSHSAEQSTLETIEVSEKPIAVTHANPVFWKNSARNKSYDVLRALADSGGMLGFSLYPHHLKEKSECTLESFCEMIARTVDIMGMDAVGIGSDLCQDQPNTVVEWMRNGRWSRVVDYGEGTSSAPGFPDMPSWFKDNRDFINLEEGLIKRGFSPVEAGKILGDNWFYFFEKSF